jgi:hypothetical protein
MGRNQCDTADFRVSGLVEEVFAVAAAEEEEGEAVQVAAELWQAVGGLADECWPRSPKPSQTCAKPCTAPPRPTPHAPPPHV